MELLSGIINDLVDDSISLQRSLLKTKVLASRINNKTLLNWVTSELEGYNEPDSITPTYRKTASNVIGSYINGRAQYKNVAIPIYGLSKDFEDFLTKFDLPSGIQTIESMINQNDTGRVQYGLPAELQKIIENNIRANGNPYFQIIEVHKEASTAFLTEIIATVRSKLLDFALELERTFGIEVDIVALSKKDKSINEKITSIMNQTIINTTGHGNIISTGNENDIVSNSTVTISNLESLKNHLKENGVEGNDLDDLIKIIDKDNPIPAEKKFGSKVNEWTKKMLGKSIDGTWKVSISVAGKLLADAIQTCYGWK